MLQLFRSSCPPFLPLTCALQKRSTEHKSVVKREDKKNGIAMHAKKHQHQVDWEGAEVLLQETRYWKRRVLKALEIQTHEIPLTWTVS